MSLDARGVPPQPEPRDRPRHRVAEALDVAILALVVLANIVAAAGGFRWENDSLRLSISSPSRAILLSAVLVFVRWWRFPGAPAHPGIGRAISWARARFEAASIALPRPDVGGTAGEWVAIAGVFLALVGAMGFQQWTALDSVPDFGDPLFSIWRLGWVAHQLPRDALHLFDGNMFFPEPRTLAYSDSMLATSLMAAPFLWFGFPQVVVYNVIFLLSFAASGVAMYALVRALTCDRWAAAVAGVAFAFYPFRFEHFSHLELQITFWMPLALLMLHRTIASGSVRDGVATGVLVALQTLSSLYYGLFLLVVMAVVWAVVSFGARRADGAPARKWKDRWLALRPWLAAGVVLAIMVLPAVVPYFQNRAQLGERPDWEARLYSATPGSYLVAHVRNFVYGRWLDGPRLPELSLFPGLGIVALALVGAWPKLNAPRAAYVLAALVAFDGSLGANGVVFPTLRDYLLPFRGLRVPARFSLLLGLALAVLAGYGVQRIRQSGRVRGAMTAVVPLACAAILLIENASNLTVARVPDLPPVYDYFKGAAPSVIVDLPFPGSLVEATRDARFLYFSTFHWQRLLTGSSGYFPESFRESVRMMRGFPSDRGLAYLSRRGVEFIVIDSAMCKEGEFAKTVAFLDANPAVTVVRRTATPGHEGVIYRMVSASYRSFHHSTR